VDTARAAAGTALAARLELTFERRGPRTVLARSYAEPPFRVGPAMDVDGAAYLIIVCAGPGIFAGDDLRQSIHVGRGAGVVLTSHSALQIHPPMKVSTLSESTAVLRHDYRVDEDGELHADWDPAIPFADARLDQRIAIDLADGARLFWSDALMAGRVGRGEAWRFASLSHELRVRARGALAYLERYTLTTDRSTSRTWIAGDATHSGTALVAHAGVTTAAAAELHAALESALAPDVVAAVDCLQDGLMLARFLSASGNRFAAAREAARTFAHHSIFGRAAVPKRK